MHSSSKPIVVLQQAKEVAGKLNVDMMVVQGEELDQKGFGGDTFVFTYIIKSLHDCGGVDLIIIYITEILSIANCI